MVDVALRHAEAFLASLPERAVGPPVDPDVLRAALGHELTDEGVPPEQVIDELVAGADPGIVATAGPRYFGFVTGGVLPAALAADWLTSAWDQNAHLWVGSPAAAVVEEVVEEWVLDVLGLPKTASVGLVTGAQMANATCLAVARDTILKREGWDVAGQGLIGAPPLTVIAGEEAHATIFTALRLIGLGRDSATLVATDDQGALDPDALARALTGPAIVCAQAGNVNSGAFDPLEPIEYLCEQSGAWLHVDGAFGLWALADPTRARLVAGLDRADSWATDGHKWLNVTYDCGIAFVREPAALRRTFSAVAGYLPPDDGFEAMHHTPQSSQRARQLEVWAVLRTLGRSGVAALVQRTSDTAAAIADRLRAGGLEVVNDVVLNQVLVRAGSADTTNAVLAAVQADGRVWCGGTQWQGAPAMRISVSSWKSSPADADRVASVILDCAHLSPPPPAH